MKYQDIFTRMTKLRKLRIASVGNNVKSLKHKYIAGKRIHWPSHFGKLVSKKTKHLKLFKNQFLLEIVGFNFMFPQHFAMAFITLYCTCLFSH